MTNVLQDILRGGVADYVSLVEVQNDVATRGVSDPIALRTVAEEVVRDIVLRGLATLGYPNAAAGGFEAWPGSPAETLARMRREWDAAEPDDCGNFIGWLSLTEAGKRTGEQLLADRAVREQQFMLELVRRWPVVAGYLDLNESADRQRLTLDSLAREIALGKAPSFREPLPTDVVRAVFTTIDELYEESDEPTRDVIFSKLALAYSMTMLRERIDKVLSRLGPILRQRLEEQLDVWEKLGMVPD